MCQVCYCTTRCHATSEREHDGNREDKHDDGGENVQGIVAYREGLAGKIRLRLLAAETLDHGVVQLHYAVLPTED
jgi:hypothetical protein